jgi:hypothetical protein
MANWCALIRLFVQNSWMECLAKALKVTLEEVIAREAE